MVPFRGIDPTFSTRGSSGALQQSMRVPGVGRTSLLTVASVALLLVVAPADGYQNGTFLPGFHACGDVDAGSWGGVSSVIP